MQINEIYSKLNFINQKPRIEIRYTYTICILNLINLGFATVRNLDMCCHAMFLCYKFI